MMSDEQERNITDPSQKSLPFMDWFNTIQREWNMLVGNREVHTFAQQSLEEGLIEVNNCFKEYFRMSFSNSGLPTIGYVWEERGLIRHNGGGFRDVASLNYSQREISIIRNKHTQDYLFVKKAIAHEFGHILHFDTYSRLHNENIAYSNGIEFAICHTWAEGIAKFIELEFMAREIIRLEGLGREGLIEQDRFNFFNDPKNHIYHHPPENAKEFIKSKYSTFVTLVSKVYREAIDQSVDHVEFSQKFEPFVSQHKSWYYSMGATFVFDTMKILVESRGNLFLPLILVMKDKPISVREIYHPEEYAKRLLETYDFNDIKGILIED